MAIRLVRCIFPIKQQYYLHFLDAFSFAVVHFLSDFLVVFLALLVDFVELFFVLFALLSDLLLVVLAVLLLDGLEDVLLTAEALEEVEVLVLLSEAILLLLLVEVVEDLLEVLLALEDVDTLFFDELEVVLALLPLGALVSPRVNDTLDFKPLNVAAPIPDTFRRSSTLENLPFAFR